MGEGVLEAVGPGWSWAPDPSNALVRGSTSARQQRRGEVQSRDKAAIFGLIRLEKGKTGLTQTCSKISWTPEVP